MYRGAPNQHHSRAIPDAPATHSSPYRHARSSTAHEYVGLALSDAQSYRYSRRHPAVIHAQSYRYTYRYTADFHAQSYRYPRRYSAVIHTPGHTPGSVGFYFAAPSPLLLAGDTLFADSVGRTDLLGGSFPELECSIRERLYVLPGETRVIPGHGPETSIAHEREHNPFVPA